MESRFSPGASGAGLALRTSGANRALFARLAFGTLKRAVVYPAGCLSVDVNVVGFPGAHAVSVANVGVGYRTFHHFQGVVVVQHLEAGTGLTFLSLGAGRTHRALRASGALGTISAVCAFRASLALVTLVTLVTLVAFIALRALRARNTLGSLLALSAGVTDRTPRALFALVALLALQHGDLLRSQLLKRDRTRHTRGTNRAGLTGRPLLPYQGFQPLLLSARIPVLHGNAVGGEEHPQVLPPVPLMGPVEPSGPLGHECVCHDD